MTEYASAFELGVNGNNILASDPGSPTKWAFAGTGGTTTLKYSNLQKYQMLSAQVVTDALQNGGSMEWNPPGWTSVWGRLYIYFAQTITSGTYFIYAYDLAGDNLVSWRLYSATNGTLGFRDASDVDRCITTNVTPINQWVRIEFHAVCAHSPNGLLELKLFNDANSTSPTEVRTASGINTATLNDKVQIGCVAPFQSNATYYFDNIVLNDTGYPGPAPASDANAVFRSGRGSAW